LPWFHLPTEEAGREPEKTDEETTRREATMTKFYYEFWMTVGLAIGALLFLIWLTTILIMARTNQMLNDLRKMMRGRILVEPRQVSHWGGGKNMRTEILPATDLNQSRTRSQNHGK
jgi:hypothetical protein